MGVTPCHAAHLVRCQIPTPEHTNTWGFCKYRQRKFLHNFTHNIQTALADYFQKLYLKWAWGKKFWIWARAQTTKFFWGCQATLIIHNVSNSTYELGIQHVLSFTNRVIQEATKINMTEGTDKAGPVTRHNKGFDLLQTPLPHFCPAKLPNLFSALQKWSLKARNVIPKTLRCQQVHVTKGYVTLGLTPERRKEKPQSVQHLPSTQRTPNYCHVTGISLIGLASSQNSKWFSSHLGMHFQQRTTTSPHPPNFQWNVL